jgi:hypothetical protein
MLNNSTSKVSMKTITPKPVAVIAVIIAAIIFRLIPHWPNFTPLAAIALLSGAYIADKRMALIVPLLALLISDLVTITFINSGWTTIPEFFSNAATALIYLSYLLMTFIGFRIQTRQTNGSLVLSALGCSVLFFVMSNFGVWMINDLPKNLTGLFQTYMLGVPFFAYDIAGNLFYTLVTFSMMRVIVSTWPALSMRAVKN